jgi:hypothetical protein
LAACKVFRNRLPRKCFKHCRNLWKSLSWLWTEQTGKQPFRVFEWDYEDLSSRWDQSVSIQL